MSRMLGFRALTALAVLAGVRLSLAAGPEVTYQPVWPGIVPASEYVPILVTVENDGPDAVGLVEARTTGALVRMPVQLPRGTSQTAVMYVPREAADRVSKLVLSTNRGSVELPLELTLGGASMALGVVSDTPGLYQLTRKEKGKVQPITNSTCRPDDAPDRSVGYEAFSHVVLAEGAERLSDASVAAIKRAVLSGVWLVVPGGSRLAVANDPRWEGWIPVGGLRAARLSGLPSLGVREPLSVAVGTPRPGAFVERADGVPVAVSSSMGLGGVVFLAFDPTEGALRKSPNRSELVTGLLPATTPLGQFKANSLMAGPRQPGSPATGSIIGGDDPFEIQLPTQGRVWGLLLGFVLVVVPINFFVLRLMRRQELAWVTCPLISLAFAAAFFWQAAALYDAAPARETRGVLIAANGHPEATVWGYEQLFLPRAGTYDLKLRGVEVASAPPQLDMPFGRSPETLSSAFIDIGQVVAPAASVGNLSFRQWQFRQTVPGAWAVEAALRRRGDRVVGRMRNLSGREMSNLRLVGSTWSTSETFSLPPGEVQDVDLLVSDLARTDVARAPIGDGVNLSGEVFLPEVGSQAAPPRRRTFPFVLSLGDSALRPGGAN
jgi:hypothetical protein